MRRCGCSERGCTMRPVDMPLPPQEPGRDYWRYKSHLLSDQLRESSNWNEQKRQEIAQLTAEVADLRQQLADAEMSLWGSEAERLRATARTLLRLADRAESTTSEVAA